MEYVVCAKEYVRSRSTELAQRNGEWGSGGVEGVSFVVPLKDEDGVSGGVRRDGGRRARSKGPSFLVGEDDGEDARAFLDLVVEQDAAFAGSDLTNDITLEIFFHGLDDSCRYTSGSEESNLDARKTDEDSMAKGTHSTF